MGRLLYIFFSFDTFLTNTRLLTHTCIPNTRAYNGVSDTDTANCYISMAMNAAKKGMVGTMND